MHPLWSAFVGVGIFVLVAQRKRAQGSSSPSWLAVPLLLFGWVAHMVWNALAIALSGLNIIVVVFINIFVVFLPFAVVFRDFLGGHFNFFDFLTPVYEPGVVPAPAQPEPPVFPPPPPQP